MSIISHLKYLRYVLRHKSSRNKKMDRNGVRSGAGKMKTVIFDFDGVIHSYESGWQGATNIPDPPVDGIREEIQRIRDASYKIVVVSARCYQDGGIEAIKKYLDKHNIVVDDVTHEKPPAIVQIDDRAICFDGKAGGLLERIDSFVPWNNKKV